MRQALRNTQLSGLWRAARELTALFAGVAVVPLAPVLAAAYGGLPWPTVVLASAWAPSWYGWLWMRLRTPSP